MEEKLVRQQDNPGAVLNTDGAALEAYKKRKRATRQQQERINKLEDDISEIKSLLKQLMEKGANG